MRPIKITSKRDFKKVLAQMISLKQDESQSTIYHNRNVDIKSFRGHKVVKVNKGFFPNGYIYLAQNMFYDETENSSTFDDARL